MSDPGHDVEFVDDDGNTVDVNPDDYDVDDPDDDEDAEFSPELIELLGFDPPTDMDRKSKIASVAKSVASEMKMLPSYVLSKWIDPSVFDQIGSVLKHDVASE